MSKLKQLKSQLRRYDFYDKNIVFNEDYEIFVRENKAEIRKYMDTKSMKIDIFSALSEKEKTKKKKSMIRDLRNQIVGVWNTMILINELFQEDS